MDIPGEEFNAHLTFDILYILSTTNKDVSIVNFRNDLPFLKYVKRDPSTYIMSFSSSMLLSVVDINTSSTVLQCNMLEKDVPCSSFVVSEEVLNSFNDKGNNDCLSK